MPNDELLKILFDTKIELEKTLNLTPNEIQKEALEYFKTNKKRIFETFISNRDDKKKLYLSAGASGAGKSEFVKSLNRRYNLNIIDTDEIRKLFPYYSGTNANLFQKASIKTVEYLLDNSFKHNYSFILDTNLANFSVADKNIKRALKRDYKIEIYFIYRNYNDCKKLTQIREENEARVVPQTVFIQKAKGSLDTIKQISKEYIDEANLSFTIIDLDRDDMISSSEIERVQSRLEFYEKELELYMIS
ncbi:hypothetical protein MNB_SV-15-673 [hydrothermal vent metagenome]|uniref:Zeta toxin domain-containing protein n=1 Tax=hydrothermal vent metagenome TaxID=652676 RepID=A0A1W1EHR2_9ZZZZ